MIVIKRDSLGEFDFEKNALILYHSLQEFIMWIQPWPRMLDRSREGFTWWIWPCPKRLECFFVMGDDSLGEFNLGKQF